MASLLPEFSEPQDFEYDALDLETRIVVRQRTSELKHLMRRTAQDIVEIGQKLIEVRKQLGYGNFRKWLKAEFDWSHTAATKFIQVAQEFGCINFMQVDIAASALYLLAAPSTPEEARQEALERASQGEIITHALAKQIRFHHTIDVEAEVVKDDEDSPAPVQPPPVPKPQSQPELVNEPLPPTTELEAQPEIPPASAPRPQPKSLIKAPAEPELPEATGPEPGPELEKAEESSSEREANTLLDFEVGDRVRILRRQHGEDNWAGETARIWQITPDGWLRVDVEGHEGVRFTLKPEWVERMPEEASKQFYKQPEPVVPQAGADEPDPESPAPSEQSQGDQLNSLEKRVRTTLTLNGEAVEVEGVITHVRFEWQRGDHSGDVQVPVDQVKFLE